MLLFASVFVSVIYVHFLGDKTHIKSHVIIQDEIGLPVLMIYKAGKQEHILVRVTDDLGENFADRDLVALLAKYGGFIFTVDL